MSMNIDKPLDDLVQANRKSRSTRGGLARRGSAPRAPAAPRAAVVQDNSAGAAAARARYGGRASGPRTGGAPVAALPAQGAVVGDKIVISNLPDDVTEVQINELFTSTIGPLRSASLAYNAQGKSKGVATIQFMKPADANKAYLQYNKRLIDGKRAMKVEIIVDPSRVAPVSLGARLGAAPVIPTAPRVAKVVPIAKPGEVRGEGAARGRGGKRGGRGGRKGGDERPKATLESLDAEMSDYHTANAAVKGETTVV